MKATSATRMCTGGVPEKGGARESHSELLSILQLPVLLLLKKKVEV